MQHPPPPMVGGAAAGRGTFRIPPDHLSQPPPGVSAPPAGSSRLRDNFDKDTVAYVLEDSRLSTLQRRLIREPNTNVSLALAVQISESIVQPDNRAYVKRATDVLCDAIVDVFYSKLTEQVKKESCVALGRVGAVLAEQQDFDKFYGILWKGYEKCKKENLQVYFLRSLVSFLEMRPAAVSDQDINRILEDLQDLLEKTENGSVMLALVDSLQQVSRWRPKLFEPCFQDVVDIMVGWHIDSSQDPAVRIRTSEVLLSWHSFWVIDMEFSSSLLRHFMEDLGAHADDVARTESRDELRQLCERILSLVQVFNTVLSCLKSPSNAVSFLPPESSEWCRAMVDCFNSTLAKCFDEDILVAGQHSLVLLLERIDSLFGQHKRAIMEFTLSGAESFRRLSFAGKESLLLFLTRMLSLADKGEQAVLLGKVLDPRSPVGQAMFSLDKRVGEASANLFRVLLNSKSVIVLQEVYSHLMCLLEESVHRLGGVPRFLKSSNKFKEKALSHRQLRTAFFFVLSSLSNVVAGKGSVLSMWALEPPVFAVLAHHSGVQSAELASSCPWLHHTLLKTLIFHCATHSCFVSSSSALASATQQVSSSPTSGHFADIISAISKMLHRGEAACSATLNLVLDWLEKLLLAVALNGSTHAFRGLDEVKLIHKNVLGMTMKKSKEDTLRLLAVVQKLTAALGTGGAQDPETLSLMHSVFGQHLRSVHPQVQEKASELIRGMPPLALDWRTSEKGQKKEKRTQAIHLLRNIQQSRPSGISPNDFKTFVEALLKGPLTGPRSHQDKVTKHLELNFPRDPVSSANFLSVLGNEDLRTLWMSVAVSHYCVNNKLKTPLGKAQDTLTTIEKVIKNVLQNLQDGGDKARRVNLGECHRLLTFHRCLEVAMCNAFDGSAVTMAPPPKSIAVFFAANKKTCLEWLSRLRVPVVELAYLAGDYAYVVQNAYDALPRLAAAARAQKEKGGTG